MRWNPMQTCPQDDAPFFLYGEVFTETGEGLETVGHGIDIGYWVSGEIFTAYHRLGRFSPLAWCRPENMSSEGWPISPKAIPSAGDCLGFAYD